ncbi:MULTISPECIES: 3'-5' exonuclease [unclassified Streptomyces]|uniref:3'-5' exonuclease n=1 Tax=unclassified Streptomyces TaxID=2593676 RepID=UPI002271129C|nr:MULTISPECIES: 3'-5' exonuclease [unclassified Streptomyces]MCY0923547.1 3'-5' exonuclease [Streptomyces sp. H27-G5]MCY0962683.1 3'-5' exonuclease [Streptomyces sp. H27-H5]
MWGDLFDCEVDERPVQFVRPADTDRPTWAVYEGGSYLGTVNAQAAGDTVMWRSQTTRESHRRLDDAVRALRRPPSWPREREQVSQWARRLLADDSLVALDVETTGLENAFAVQIAAVAPGGTVVFNEYVNPCADIEPAAIAVHGITPQSLTSAPAFGELLPALTDALHGRTVLAYNMPFDRSVLERELVRHHGTAAAAARWFTHSRWEDAMVPYAVWKGLWSVKRGAYRNQRLGGSHDAVSDCQALLAKTGQMAAPASSTRW